MTRKYILLGDRVVLKTTDNKVIVRPKAPGAFKTTQDGTLFILSDTGKEAWDNGEDISFDEGHICGAIDNSVLLHAKI